jgi:hypothetical protein
MKSSQPGGTVTWENKLFAIGFIKDAPLPYFEFADGLSKPAAYFRNDDLWRKMKNAGALGNYWQIVSAALERSMEQRKIFISNVSLKLIEDPKYSHKITLAEVRLILLPGNKYRRFTHGPYEVFAPQELGEAYKSHLPAEILKA